MDVNASSSPSLLKKIVPTLLSLAYKHFNYKTITALYKEHKIPGEILVEYFTHEKMYDVVQLYIRDFGLSLPPLDTYLSSVTLNDINKTVERMDTTVEPLESCTHEIEVIPKSGYTLKMNATLAYNKFIYNYENDVKFRKLYKSKYKRLCDIKRLDSFLKVVY